MPTFVRFSLRGVSVIAALVLASVFGVLAAVAIARTMASSDTEEAGQLAMGAAGVATGILERNLRRSTDDMVHLRELLQDTRLWTDRPRLQRWLESLQRGGKGYSWIGLADPSGRIVVGTGGLAVGADVSGRDWFRGGLQGIHHGDLHEAMLLQKALPPLPNGEPWRFLDISLPVQDAQGRLVGVLAAHLSWPWLRGTLETAGASLPHSGSLWVLGPDNRARLGDDPHLTGTLALRAIDRARAGESGWMVETWPDGRRYVTGYAPNIDRGPLSAFGWVTLVRAPADAVTPTDRQELADMMAAIALSVVLITLAAWGGASLWLRPLREFVDRIGQLREGQRPPPLPRVAPQEFHELNHAILRLVDRLQEKEAETHRSLVTVQDSFRTVGSSIPGTLSTFSITSDHQLSFMFASESHELYYAVTAAEILAQPEAWQRHVEPQDLLDFRATFQAQLEGGARSFSHPMRVTGADGVQRTLQVTLVQRDAADGFIFDAISLDITELHAARQAAEQANRAKSDFLATMSHELRTPLNAILGFAQVLEGSLDDPTQRQQARYMRETGETLTRILNDVLDIAKIESGKFDLDPRPFAMEQVFDSCASIFRVVSADKGVAFDIRTAPGLPPLVGDPVRLRQILHNLLSNAFKFTASGRVELDLTLLRLAPRPGGGRVAHLRIEVRDTGMGMTAEQVARLFQRFEQATRSISGQYGGTGLGLAIVKALVEKMDGSVEVRSQPGAGTCFTLHLPFAVATPGAAEAADPAQPEAPLHVLVVDDFPVNRAVLRALLEKRGHRVTEAEDGVQALQQVALVRPALVLMDLDMPNLDGLEATRRIRRMPDDALAMTPVYALTGKAFAEDIERTLAAGLNGHLAKPVQLDDLVRVLRTASPEGAPA